jgi:hypothetical protein
VPQALRNKPEDTLVVLLTGRELGFGAMQSLRGINVIQGKGVLGADTMGALVMSRRDVCGHLSLVETTADHATYATQRTGAPKPVTMTYTIAQAKQAGLATKDNWKNHPDAMLRARCLSAICRAVYPDLVAGLYIEDEGDEIAGRGRPTSMPMRSAAPIQEAEVVEDAEPDDGAYHGISNEQAQRIFAIGAERAAALRITSKRAGEGIVRQVYEAMGIVNTSEVTPERYDEVCAAVASWGSDITGEVAK